MDTHPSTADSSTHDVWNEAALHAALVPVAFANPHAAARTLLRWAADARIRPALTTLLPHLLTALAEAAAPDQVLLHLGRLAANAADGPAFYHYLAENPRAVEILVTLFAGSQFLTEILMRNPDYLRVLVAHNELTQPKSLDQFCADARACTLEGPAPSLDALKRFQRWELLRIGACDLLDAFDLTTVTAQLSHLADSVVQACLAWSSVQAKQASEGFVVLAMGKLGGGELNYSSDIDLLFLAAKDPTNYTRLGERLIRALTERTAEGFLYRVDMRLRPWGQVGALVNSVEGYLRYLQRNARLWEKQALLKARPIAGDLALGETFLKQVNPLIYGEGDPEHTAIAVRHNVYAMKQRTEEHLVQQGRGWGEVKLGQGSIRDVEFVVQYLQLAHGAEAPGIRGRRTLEALPRLVAAGHLSPGEARVLQEGYVFFRGIEHYLQMMHYRQTHTLPQDASALQHLAQRLGFTGDPEHARKQFLARYEQHRQAVRAVYLEHLEDRTMSESGKINAQQSEEARQQVSAHVARMDHAYAEVFSEDEVRLHTALAAQLDSDNLVEVEAVPLEEGRWRATVVGYDYAGELSLICGLLFVHGLDIHDGHVFTYESEAPAQVPPRSPPSEPRGGRRQVSLGGKRTLDRRKIVDVFTVEPARGEVTAGTWARYAEDLNVLLRLTHNGQRSEAAGKLAQQVAVALQDNGAVSAALYPVEIEIDNDLSERYTVLRIDALDTLGFLYELSNALALRGVYIAQVTVGTVHGRVQDVLYVTDGGGHKITDPAKQRELRAATVLIKHFTHLLPYSPNPEAAMLRFRQFIGRLFTRPDWPDELASIERPEVLDALSRLLGVSEFLWDDFLRMQHANLFPVVTDVGALESTKSRAELQAELEHELRLVHDGPQPPVPAEQATQAPWRETLNAFKDREMFRIDMRHIMGHTQEFWDFSRELTDLAEVVVNSAYHLCHEDLRAVYGAPLLEDGAPSEMAVLALGKCGGRELGFASDIELLFVYAGNGRTTGPAVIATSEFYERVVQDVLRSIQAKREGIFELDLQLRPYGKAGSMAVSLEAFRRYFAPDGPAWPYERQALVKLRPIAGNAGLGEHVAALRDRYVYTGVPYDVPAMRAMRERQVRHLVTGGTFNAKYSRGGLVDVEYLVQGLQITHGRDRPELRLPNIREAMAALAQAGILSEEQYTRLRRAHTFLRWLIDGLRMVRGNAKDLTVPEPESEGFSFLARRLRYGSDVARLREELDLYTTWVQELSAELLDPIQTNDE